MSLATLRDRRTIRIRTPEGIVFALLSAGPAIRFFGWLIDLAVIMAMTLGLQALLLSVEKHLPLAAHPDFRGGFFTLVFFGLSIGYGMVLEWFWHGRTVGKWLLRLRVMDEQCYRLRFNQVFIRNLLRFIDALPLFYFVGGVAALFSRHGQRLGDFAANTVVVRTPALSELDVAQLTGEHYNSFRRAPHLEARLRRHTSPAEAGLLLQALMRRSALAPEARLRLFKDLANHLRQKANFPPTITENLSDEQYLRNAVDTLYRE